LYLITTLISKLKYIRIGTIKNINLRFLKAYYPFSIKDIR